MNNQRCVLDTEAANDTLNLIVSKALGLPAAGVHIGGGLHVTLAQSWDGQGPTPPGWTKQAVANYVASAADAALPLPDDLVTVLQGPPAQANLSGAEKGRLTAAINGRSMVDLDVGRSPKASISAMAKP